MKPPKKRHSKQPWQVPHQQHIQSQKLCGKVCTAIGIGIHVDVSVEIIGAIMHAGSHPSCGAWRGLWT